MYIYIYIYILNLQNIMLLPCRYGPGTQGPGTIWAMEPRGQGPKKGAVRGLGRPMRPFWVPDLVPGPWVPWPIWSLAPGLPAHICKAET